MLFRMMSLCFLILGLAVSGARAEEKKADKDTHDGKIVNVSGTKFTMTGRDGKNEHTMTAAPDAKITCDGKDCKLADLKPGVFVRVTTKPGDKETALRIDASTKEPVSKDKGK